jgi:hypothetical protein
MKCGREACNEKEDRIDGYCSVYCRDVDEAWMEVARLEAKIDRQYRSHDMKNWSDLSDCFEGHDFAMLRRRAKQLKGTDGEGWAIGELAERMIDLLAEQEQNDSP